jgi:hypothetical protein
MDKIDQLENLARTMIGDEKTPDLFFVTDRGQVVSVDVCALSAYGRFMALARRPEKHECALENRTFGVIASIEPIDDTPNARRVLCDDFRMFQRSEAKKS